ncbi:hypothetical protein BDY24DRAFT_395062 [Mrakia frigida]|uniref:uncharacterized protein n=1 Tax=Mrakia frigida TaxID=29902 RepID=UPI003FCC1603
MSQPDASSSSSKKRKTVESSTSDEPSSSSSTTYSEDFNDPEGDVVLQSSDNVLFRVQRFYLQAASTVFRDMLAIPQPPSNGSSSPPVVKLEESSKDLKHFLHAVLGRAPRELTDPLAWPAVRSIATLSNKYGAENLAANASHRYIADALGENDFVSIDGAGSTLDNYPTLIDTWAFACQQKHLYLARTALRLFATNSVEYDTDVEEPWGKLADVVVQPTRSFNLGDISDEHLVKLSISTIKNFSQL